MYSLICAWTIETPSDLRSHRAHCGVAAMIRRVKTTGIMNSFAVEDTGVVLNQCLYIKERYLDISCLLALW